MSVICVCHTSSHLHTHIFTYYIFLCTSSHTHIFTLTHTHLYIFSLSLSHTYIFTSSLTLTSSHTHIFSFSLSHSHLHILTSSLSLLSLSFSLSRLLYLSLFRPRVVPARSHETSTLSHEMRVDAQKLRSNCDFTCAGLVPQQPFRTKWGSMRKNWGKIACDFTCAGLVPEQPFRTKWGSIVKNWGKIASLLLLEQPFPMEWWSMVKNWVGMVNFTRKIYEWINELHWFLACGVYEQSWLVCVACWVGMLNFTLKKI